MVGDCGHEHPDKRLNKIVMQDVRQCVETIVRSYLQGIVRNATRECSF